MRSHQCNQRMRSHHVHNEINYCCKCKKKQLNMVLCEVPARKRQGKEKKRMTNSSQFKKIHMNSEFEDMIGISKAPTPEKTHPTALPATTKINLIKSHRCMTTT